MEYTEIDKDILDIVSNVYEWNSVAWNEYWKWIDVHLESSMVTEEFSEYIIALKNWDIHEMQDAFVDILIVIAGTFHKLWIPISKTYKTMENILASNFSKFNNNDWKFEVIKDSGWKIMKWENYFKPNLSHLDWLEFKKK